MKHQEQVTQILKGLGSDGLEVMDRIAPVLYEELRAISRRVMIGQRPSDSLQPTALVNEVYLRMAQRSTLHLENRAHVFRFAAKAMRQILIDHARKRSAERRGGGAIRVELEGLASPDLEEPTDFLAISEAIDALTNYDERKARIVELRYFGGLKAEETAEVLGISIRTVERESRFARAWLKRFLQGDNTGESPSDQ